MKVKFKKFDENAVVPIKATEGAAAYDVYTPYQIKVKKGRQIIPLDFGLQIPYGYEAKIEPRSGFSAKGMEGLYYDYDLSCMKIKRFDADVIVGKIDSDYRGKIGVIVKSNEEFVLPRASRIAQMTIYKVEDVEFIESDNLSETARGEGGFGHTGTK